MATNKPTISKLVPDVYLGGQGGTSEPAFGGYATPSSNPSVAEWKRNLLAAADAMPVLGGGLGQLAGTITAAPAAAAPPLWWMLPAMDMAGGGIGGAIGQMGREAAYRAMGYPDAPGTISGASKEQAAASVAGTVLAPAAQIIAKQGYKNLFRPTVKMLREDPRLLELAYKLDATIPREGSKSALRAAQNQSKEAADNLLRSVGETLPANDQPMVPWSELDEAEAAALRRAGKGDTGDTRAAIKAYFEDVRANWNPSGDPNMPLTYEQLMVIKRGADDTSSPVYRAKLAASHQAKPDGYYKGAEALRNHIMGYFDDGTAAARVPGLRKINNQTQQFARVAALAEESALPRKFNYFAPHHGTNPLSSTAGLAAGAAANFLGASPFVSTGAAHLATMGTSAAAEASKPALSSAMLFMAKNPNFRYGISQLPRAADYLMGYPFNPNLMPVDSSAQSGPFGTARPGDIYLDGEH
jgi:hypothetical protein